MRGSNGSPRTADVSQACPSRKCARRKAAATCIGPSRATARVSFGPKQTKCLLGRARVAALSGANLYGLIQSHFPADRTKPCLLLPDGREVPYAMLEQGVGRAAALLRAKGVKPGDRIAAQGEKSVG